MSISCMESNLRDIRVPNNDNTIPNKVLNPLKVERTSQKFMTEDIYS